MHFLLYPCLRIHPSAFVNSMQVKPSKRAKKNKPSEEPVVVEPVINASAPDSSTHQPPLDPASDIPVPTFDPSAEDTLNTNDPETPSPVKTNEPEVEIVRSQFVEPGWPTILVKCSTKEELAERRKAKQDITDYTHLSIGDIV